MTTTNVGTLTMWPAVAAEQAASAAEQAASAAESPGRVDRELALSAAGGDDAAFEQLYERHHRRVYSLCLRMTQNVSEAEDLTQEVFIQLYRKVGLFRGDSAFTTWLHRMTVNQVLMYFRKKRSRVELTSEDGDAPPHAAAAGTEDPTRMPIVDRIEIDRALERLPVGYRTVLVLHDIEGYEHEEIARLLGIAAGTSKSQLHKARMKLRKLLKRR